ncbi:MAG: Mg-chelatase subunit ChlD [Planctomycetota bacterium]|nr:Mg-chelatase subunit ChlD [Planctomycetota bacterium]
MNSPRVVVVALSLSVALLAQSGVAQETAAPTPKGEPSVKVAQTDEKGFPNITVEFEVKSPTGGRILDATQDDFRVEEYGSPVVFTGFRSPISKEFRPTTVVLVLDRSGSMMAENRIGGLKQAVSAFLRRQPEGSRVAVIAFGDEVELICPFTDDPDRVRLAVGDLIPGGKTRYYDAVSAAIKLLGDETGRRAVLAMTDGEDNQSRSTLTSVVLEARRQGLAVHTLGLGSEEEIETDKLRELADSTRGKSFSAREADGLRTIFEEIAEDLGGRYSLTYRTQHELQDGTLRPIRVYYKKSSKAGEYDVYIPGMVVPAAGWSWLFLSLVVALGTLTVLPSRLRR